MDSTTQTKAYTPEDIAYWQARYKKALNEVKLFKELLKEAGILVD